MLLALLLVTSFSLITVDYRGGEDSPLDGVRSAAATVFGPVERVAAAIAAPVSDAVDGVSGLGGGGADADRLAAQNKALRSRLRTSALDRSRAQELDELLKIAGRRPVPHGPGRVIAIGAAQGFSWTVTIDVGSRDGIRPDMTVLNGDGLVGRVTTVGPTTSTVLLANDPESSIGVRLEGSRSSASPPARASGTAATSTSGCSTASPAWSRATGWSPSARRATSRTCPGVPVGRVVTVSGSPGSLTRTAVVAPYVDFTALDLVGVVVEPPRKDPRDAVLPPKPAATPTPTVTVTVTATPSPRRFPLMPPARILLAALLVVVALVAPGDLPQPAAAAGRDARPAAARRGLARPGLRAGLRALSASGPGWPPTSSRPPTTRSAGRRWCSPSSATSPVLARGETRRSAFVPLVVVGVAGAASVLLYAGLGALMDDPNITWDAVVALLPTAVLYDVVLSAFVVPGVLAVAGRVEPDPDAFAGVLR